MLKMKFNNIETKHEILEKKKYKRTLLSYEVGLNTAPDQQIYIREELTNFKRLFFKEGISLKELLHFKFLWANDSKIYIPQ